MKLKRRKKFITFLTVICIIFSYTVYVFAEAKTVLYSLDSSLSPCWKESLGCIAYNNGYSTSVASGASGSCANAGDFDFVVRALPLMAGDYSHTITESFNLGNGTLGSGAISLDTYYANIGSGCATSFGCSSSYDGSHNHRTCGIGYVLEGSYPNQSKIIQYADPYDQTVKLQSYDVYKAHYWYDTNYNIRKN